MNFEICKKCQNNSHIKYDLYNGIPEDNLDWINITQLCNIIKREKDYISILCEARFNKDKRINSFEEINPDDWENCKCYTEQLIDYLNKE